MAWKKYKETNIKCCLNPLQLIQIQSTHFTTQVSVIYHTDSNQYKTGRKEQSKADKTLK